MEITFVGNVCGHVTRLCLDDGQSRDRTAAVLGRNAGCTFKQARMQIEYIAGICFTSRRAANQQRKCAVSNGVFAQIIVNNENILALFAGNTRPLRSRNREQCIARVRFRKRKRKR